MQENKGKILYITAQAPTGWRETFILTEMIMVKKLGVQLLIVPRNPSKKIIHKEALNIIDDCMLLPILNFKILFKALLFSIRNIQLTYRIVKEIIFKSVKVRIALKNLAVLPKTLFLSKVIVSKNISHIHSHWGSTTSTMAFILSKLTNIPWSLTLHRWDIKENNLLKEKAQSAQFVRCISEHGIKELIQLIGKDYLDKIVKIHMGVNCESVSSTYSESRKDFVIIVPANLIPVKGHKYLIKAISLLKKQHTRNLKCRFFGDGSIREQLENDIESEKLDDLIAIPGKISHEKLITMYVKKQVDVVILPSINTKGGVHEGIPVSLMEAMAYGIPVISTNTGGIPELLGDGAGMMIEERSSHKLAEAILKIKNEKGIRRRLSDSGRIKIKKAFNLEKNTKTLLKYIQNENNKNINTQIN